MELYRNGVAYSFWILDGGEWLPLCVSHITLGKRPTVTSWKITWTLGTVQTLSGGKNIQPLTRIRLGPFITA
jgi:hypothetical protein